MTLFPVFQRPFGGGEVSSKPSCLNIDEQSRVESFSNSSKFANRGRQLNELAFPALAKHNWSCNALVACAASWTTLQALLNYRSGGKHGMNASVKNRCLGCTLCGEVSREKRALDKAPQRGALRGKAVGQDCPVSRTVVPANRASARRRHARF